MLLLQARCQICTFLLIRHISTFFIKSAPFFHRNKIVKSALFCLLLIRQLHLFCQISPFKPSYGEKRCRFDNILVRKKGVDCTSNKGANYARKKDTDLTNSLNHGKPSKKRVSIRKLS